MSFANLKSSSLNRFQNLTKKVESENKSYSDDRFWDAPVDKTGTGLYVIRFLPSVDGEEFPYVKLYSHTFKEGTSWYFNNCPTTIGKKCPCCDSNTILWKTNTKENQDIVRRRKRTLKYISNILVISDKKRPENEGKVFLFKYGPTIFDFIQKAIKPDFADEKPFDPFDFWSGANFKLKIRTVDNNIKYDRSEFEKCGPIFDDDSAIEKLWNTQHKLLPFIAEDQFKSYDELKQRLDKVLDSKNSVPQRTREDDNEEQSPQPQQSKSFVSQTKPTSESEKFDIDSDESFQMFQALLNGN